jgi:ribosomal protein L37AE/L43A
MKTMTERPNDDDEYDLCEMCGRAFLARASFDNFYCDACYLSGEYLDEPGLDDEDDEDDFYAKDQGSYGDVDQIKLEGMDAVYAWEDDHPQCQNCGERLNTEDGCHCGNPIGPDDA